MAAHVQRKLEMKNDFIIRNDDQGRRIAVISVGHGRFATVLEADYLRLIAKGISTNWFMSGNGSGLDYVAAYFAGSRTTGGRVNVARLLLDLGFRETVAYRSRDRLDLRPENITRARGFAKGRETSAVMQAAA